MYIRHAYRNKYFDNLYVVTAGIEDANGHIAIEMAKETFIHETTYKKGFKWYVTQDQLDENYTKLPILNRR